MSNLVQSVYSLIRNKQVKVAIVLIIQVHVRDDPRTIFCVRYKIRVRTNGSPERFTGFILISENMDVNVKNISQCFDFLLIAVHKKGSRLELIVVTLN